MSPMRLTLALLVTLTAASSLAAQNTATMRFQAMDRNGDGIITRAEWRGSEQSFERYDWNHDGQLSGDEVRVGRSRADRQADPSFDSSDREYIFDDWTTRGFRSLDLNRDNRITRSEWRFDREGFLYADRNNDGVITRTEFFSEDGQDDDPDRFPYLDIDGDTRISRSEWHGSAARFSALDANGDEFLSQSEILGTAPPADLFASVDVDRDQTISLDEWHWSRASFDERDANRDGRLTRGEFGGREPGQAQSSAYRAGMERGLTEGREAGSAERRNKRAWDLEGQRELETADSGYQPGMGPRADYQAGYRDGFRRGYRQGWDETK